MSAAGRVYVNASSCVRGNTDILLHQWNLSAALISAGSKLKINSRKLLMMLRGGGCHLCKSGKLDRPMATVTRVSRTFFAIFHSMKKKTAEKESDVEPWKHKATAAVKRDKMWHKTNQKKDLFKNYLPALIVSHAEWFYSYPIFEHNIQWSVSNQFPVSKIMNSRLFIIPSDYNSCKINCLSNVNHKHWVNENRSLKMVFEWSRNKSFLRMHFQILKKYHLPKPFLF